MEEVGSKVGLVGSVQQQNNRGTGVILGCYQPVGNPPCPLVRESLSTGIDRRKGKSHVNFFRRQLPRHGESSRHLLPGSQKSQQQYFVAVISRFPTEWVGGGLCNYVRM
jgi:hypothetical protein